MPDCSNFNTMLKTILFGFYHFWNLWTFMDFMAATMLSYLSETINASYIYFSLYLSKLLVEIGVTLLIREGERGPQHIIWSSINCYKYQSQHSVVHTSCSISRSWFQKNLSQHFMFHHGQSMRDQHTEHLHGGNGKMNSEKVSGQLSSIQLVSPYIISPWSHSSRT